MWSVPSIAVLPLINCLIWFCRECEQRREQQSLRCFGSSLSFSLSWAFLKTRRWVAKSSTSLVVKYGCQSTSLDLRKGKIEHLMNHRINGLHFNTVFRRKNVSEHLKAVYGLWSGVASSLENHSVTLNDDTAAILKQICVRQGSYLVENSTSAFWTVWRISKRNVSSSLSV